MPREGTKGDFNLLYFISFINTSEKKYKYAL